MANLLIALLLLLPSLAWGFPGLMPPAKIPAGGGGGAFPVVAAVVTSTQTANSSNHSHALPSGIASGHLLVMGCQVDAASAVTPASGWTQLEEVNAPASTNTGYIQYRVADGGESTPFVAFTTGATERSACVTYRITGQAGSSFIESASAAIASANPINPPSLTASWGALNNLWLIFGGSDDAIAFSAMPSGFSAEDTSGDGLDRAATGNTSAGAEVIGAQKQDAVATLDPAAFSNTGNATEGTAFTVVIRPTDAE